MEADFAAHGISASSGIRMLSKQAALIESDVMQQQLIKMASSIFKAAGFREDADLCDNIAATSDPEFEFAKKAIASGTLNVLGSSLREEHLAYIEKEAAGGKPGGNPLTKFIDKLPGLVIGGTAAVGGNLLKLLAISSIGVGAASGAAYWYMNRDANLENEEITVKEEQAKYYNRLANKLRERINSDMSDYAIKNTTSDIINNRSYDSLSSSPDKRPIYA